MLRLEAIAKRFGVISVVCIGLMFADVLPGVIVIGVACVYWYVIRRETRLLRPASEQRTYSLAGHPRRRCQAD